jgi:hypothetical protein
VNHDELLAMVEDKASRVLARPGLRVERIVRDDGFAYVVVSGETHRVEPGAAIERAVMDMRPEFARTCPALREG